MISGGAADNVHSVAVSESVADEAKASKREAIQPPKEKPMFEPEQCPKCRKTTDVEHYDTGWRCICEACKWYGVFHFDKGEMTEKQVKECNKLQTKYERKMAELDKQPMIPPPIKAEILAGISKQMDRIEAQGGK